MKLLFSEAQADYVHYIFPYAIWGIPELGEAPARFFELGFLPGTPELDRFYLCRQIRINLREFTPSSENRRILRKGQDLCCLCLPRESYQCAKKSAYLEYADQKFGKDIMSEARLERLLGSRAVTHVLVFKDQAGEEAGLALLYLEEPALCFYYYAFYDLKLGKANMGMHMMTTAVKTFAERGVSFLHLGTCYSRTALYKTQFKGCEFFNGFRWSANLRELKHLIDRQATPISQHLLESLDFRNEFYENDLQRIAASSAFGIPAKLKP